MSLGKMHCGEVLELFVQWLYTDKYTELHAQVLQLNINDHIPHLCMTPNLDPRVTMDWAVKAAILAWYLGAELQVLNSQCKTWFEIHGEEAEAARPDLSPDLIQFLEQAQIPYGQEGESCLKFFYSVSGLSDPGYMFGFTEALWGDCETEDDDDGKTRLVLYGAGHFDTGHICGLV